MCTSISSESTLVICGEHPRSRRYLEILSLSRTFAQKTSYPFLDLKTIDDISTDFFSSVSKIFIVAHHEYFETDQKTAIPLKKREFGGAPLNKVVQLIVDLIKKCPKFLAIDFLSCEFGCAVGSEMSSLHVFSQRLQSQYEIKQKITLTAPLGIVLWPDLSASKRQSDDVDILKESKVLDPARWTQYQTMLDKAGQCSLKYTTKLPSLRDPQAVTKIVLDKPANAKASSKKKYF